jgi:hypothetical protein
MAASIAAADVDVKLADHHARDRQLFLIWWTTPVCTTGPAQSGQCAGSGAS